MRNSSPKVTETGKSHTVSLFIGIRVTCENINVTDKMHISIHEHVLYWSFPCRCVCVCVCV
jgi:hypothetical protein